MKRNRIICLILSVLFSLCFFVSCGTKAEKCGSLCAYCGLCQDENCNKPSCKEKCRCVTDVSTDKKNRVVEGTLHDVKISKTGNDLCKKVGNTVTCDYVFIYDDTNAFSRKAAGFVVGHINMATGASLSAVPYDGTYTWDSGRKYVVFGVAELATQASFQMPNVDLGIDGYYIKTIGKSTFIGVQKDDGYQMASLAFLREVVGYDMISQGLVVYEKDGSFLPDMEICERPDFDYRVGTCSYLTPTDKYGMGYTNNIIFIAPEFRTYHNTFTYLPPNVYYNEHPDWYSQAVNASMTKETFLFGQVCYTAHGRYEEDGSFKPEYRSMLETVCDRMITEIVATPEFDNITFTEQDSYDFCNCDACQAEKDKYGTVSATCILFCNDLADMLKERLEEEHIDRNITLYFFAYLGTVSAPATENADGTYSGTAGIRCRDNVGVIYCPIQACFHEDLSDEKNAYYTENLKKWGALTDHVAVWIYQTHFENFFYPYSTWETVAENAKVCYENNAVYFFNQDLNGLTNPIGFSDLKTYLNSKIAFDVNADLDYYTEKYFKYRFADASDYVRQIFREFQIKYDALYTEYPTVMSGVLKEACANKSLWPKKLLERWLDIFDQAYLSVEKYKSTDSVYYQEVLDRIKLESLCFRYMLITLHADAFTESDLYSLRSEFKKDCTHFEIDRTRESGADLEGIFESWGV